MAQKEQSPKAGRVNDPYLTERILDKGLQVLNEQGYADFSIERVAAAAGCGKGAIYRRWDNRDHLAAAVICTQFDIGSPRDIETGSVVEELQAHTAVNMMNQKRFHQPQGDHNLWSILAVPAIREHVWEGFLSRRRAAGLQILARAQSRGELLDDADTELILDLLAGLVQYRNAMRQIDTSNEQIHEVIVSLVTSPPHRTESRSQSFLS